MLTHDDTLHRCALYLTLTNTPLPQAGRGWGELALIVLHYAWTFGMAFACLAPLQAIAYLLLAQARSHLRLPDGVVAPAMYS